MPVAHQVHLPRQRERWQGPVAVDVAELNQTPTHFPSVSLRPAAAISPGTGVGAVLVHLDVSRQTCRPDNHIIQFGWVL
jgi:hypothetical protein